MKNFNSIGEFFEYIQSGQINENVKTDYYLGEHKIKDYCLVESPDGPYNLSFTVEGDNRPIIGNVINIDLPELNCFGLEAKVDTGAEMCCLHAEQIDFNRETQSVTFTINGKRITMNCTDTVDIQTADHGIDERPMVKLNVCHDGDNITSINFNLNDRSEMPHQILLGKEFLQAGEYLIDPIKGTEHTDAD